MFCVKISKSDFKSPAKWAEIAKSLELPAGRNEAIVMRIPGLLPVEEGMKIEQSIKQPEEWIIGESIDGHRQWIIHARKPRFIAEIFDDEDTPRLSPFEYQLDSGQWLSNFLWQDQPPEDLTLLCIEAGEAIEKYDEILGAD